MKYPPGLPAQSLRLDARELHDLGPFVGFVGDRLCEFGRRQHEHRTSEVCKPGFQLGVSECGIDLPVS